MLGTLTTELTIDAFCLTSDNGTENHCDDRERLAIGSAGLVSLALFG